MTSFDDLPLMVRKEIFQFVWPELTLSKVRELYQQHGVDPVELDMHLFGYANEMRRIGSGFIGEKLHLCGVSPKLLTVFRRLNIKTQNEFCAYYIKKQGVRTVVIWGLLKDSERSAFLTFAQPFLNGTDVFYLIAGWN
jgi:hypothetical protein